MALHGPHHVAQKSIRTGLPELIYIERGSVSSVPQAWEGVQTIVWNSSRELMTLTTMAIDKSDGRERKFVRRL